MTTVGKLLSITLGVTLLASSAIAADHLDKRIGEDIRYERISISKDKEFVIRINTYTPPGKGPFPLVIINHGVDPSGDSSRVRFQVPAREFVRRGYAVMVPQRRAFGGSEGPRTWADCQPTPYASEAQREVRATIALAKRMKTIDTNRILMVGHSVGGLVSLKSGTQNIPGIVGIVNLSGGFRWENCDWQKPLMEEARLDGASRIKSLWLYANNDPMFPPEVSEEMFKRYTKAGGKGTFHLVGTYQPNGHVFFPRRDGLNYWLPKVTDFMKSLKLPTKVIYNIPETPRPAATNFAALDDASKLPISEDNREAATKDYQNFLKQANQRAFVISEDGSAWGWSDLTNPVDEALETCNNNSNTKCRPYAIDQQVVW